MLLRAAAAAAAVASVSVSVSLSLSHVGLAIVFYVTTVSNNYLEFRIHVSTAKQVLSTQT